MSRKYNWKPMNDWFYRLCRPCEVFTKTKYRSFRQTALILTYKTWFMSLRSPWWSDTGKLTRRPSLWTQSHDDLQPLSLFSSRFFLPWKCISVPMQEFGSDKTLISSRCDWRAEDRGSELNQAAYMQRKALSEIVRSNCNELIVS